jgi:phosphate butyryltransferase
MYHITKTLLLFSLITLCSLEELDNSDKSWSRHFLKKIEEAKKLSKRRLAVAGAEEEVILRSCVEGYKLGLVDPILIGNENKIKDIAKTNNLDISKFQIIHEPDRKHAAKLAVKLI